MKALAGYDKEKVTELWEHIPIAGIRSWETRYQ